MTKEEAIEIVQAVKFIDDFEDYSDRLEIALDMAIEALKERPHGDPRDRLKEVFREASELGGDLFHLSQIERIIDGEVWLEKEGDEE